jgi:hypothetical protein
LKDAKEVSQTRYLIIHPPQPSTIGEVGVNKGEINTKKGFGEFSVSVFLKKKTVS